MTDFVDVIQNEFVLVEDQVTAYLDVVGEQTLTITDENLILVSEATQGPPGPPGRDAITNGGIEFRGAADFAISGHRMVVFDAAGLLRYASNEVIDDARRVVGLTKNAAAAGDAVMVHSGGFVDEPSWSWDTSKPIWLGRNGLLTQVEPSADAGDSFSLVVGFAMTPTRVFFKQSEPIFLA